MKRVLLMQYHFLPAHNVSVKQFLGYCKYLPEFGWEPVVLTRPWGEDLREIDRAWGLSYEPEVLRALNGKLEIHGVIESVYANPIYQFHERLKRQTDNPLGIVLRKLLSPFSQLFGLYPDPFIGWVKPAVAKAEQLHREQPFHAILASCPPETNLLAAGGASSSTGVPWLAFFGDLYGFYFGPADFHHGFLGTLVAKVLRQKWLMSAGRALAVSPYMVEYLENIYKLKGDLAVVAFEDAEHGTTSRSQKNAKLLLSHIGSIYPGHQEPQLLFDALDKLIRENPAAAQQIEVRLVGSKCETWLTETLAGRPCEAVIRVIKKVSPTEAIAMENESDALLAFNVTGFGKGSRTLSYPSKIFEYFGARRRILALPSDGDWVKTLLEQTGTGLSTSGVEDTAKVLCDWISEWSNQGTLPWHGREEKISEYTYRKQAEQIARSLDQISAPSLPKKLSVSTADLPPVKLTKVG